LITSYIKVYVSDTEAVEACIRFVDDDDDDDDDDEHALISLYTIRTDLSSHAGSFAPSSVN